MTTSQASRLVAAVMAMALLAVSTTIWQSPQARRVAADVAAPPPARALDRVLSSGSGLDAADDDPAPAGSRPPDPTNPPPAPAAPPEPGKPDSVPVVDGT